MNIQLNKHKILHSHGLSQSCDTTLSGEGERYERAKSLIYNKKESKDNIKNE